MKRELKHDILAEKIWERLPEQDKQLRQVRRSIEQRTVDYFGGKGSLAGETELVNWKDSLAKLQLAENQQQFIELSRQDVQKEKEEELRRLKALEEQAQLEKQLRKEAESAREQAENNAAKAIANEQQARRRTRIAAVVSMLAILLLVFAVFQYKNAEVARRAAVTSSDSTAIALQFADSLKVVAQESAISAEQQRKIAEEKQAEAEKALTAQLQAEEKARKDRIEKLLAEATAFRNENRFADALRTYQEVAGLAATDPEKRSIKAELEMTQLHQIKYDFERNRDVGLQMQALNDCKHALAYLQAALKVKPEDETIQKAIEKCQ